MLSFRYIDDVSDNDVYHGDDQYRYLTDNAVNEEKQKIMGSMVVSVVTVNASVVDRTNSENDHDQPNRGLTEKGTIREGDFDKS